MNSILRDTCGATGSIQDAVVHEGSFRGDLLLLPPLVLPGRDCLLRFLPSILSPKLRWILACDLGSLPLLR